MASQRIRFLIPALTASALALGLAGCGEAETGPQLVMAGPVSPGDVHQWRVIPAEARITYFEHGEPEILDVAERRIGNAVYQRTVYVNDTSVPGENYLQATVLYHPDGLDYLTEKQAGLIERSVTFTTDELAAKLEREFPNARINEGGAQPTNVYGYYGYSFARYGADVTCSYIWQVVGDRSRVLPTGFLGILLEMRLCRALPEETGDPIIQHLALFEDLRFTDKTGILPKNHLFEGLEPPSVFTYNPDLSAAGLPEADRVLTPAKMGAAPKPNLRPE